METIKFVQFSISIRSSSNNRSDLTFDCNKGQKFALHVVDVLEKAGLTVWEGDIEHEDNIFVFLGITETRCTTRVRF